ncbi:MAG TPA: bifunctional oligoribonuclease/PAP phosphatase NrnA [Opitutaceae bacterium]|jgi:phosphoesterase RecJ-like protein|nr:bifunctional oligoribonuclease/PAP phosphatase NrnA [Opitutaceae bacterium]
MPKFYSQLSQKFGRLLPTLAGKKIVVIGHARPDGDCIGAQVALARVLIALGLDAVCANPDVVPRRLRFLTPGLAFHRPDDLGKFDYTALYVDCADHGRAGEKLKKRFPLPFASVDHHLSNVGFAEHNFMDAGSSATCEILAGLFLDNHLPVDRLAAQALYVGILTDTGQFRFNSTSRRTFQLAAELMSLGAQPSEAGYQLYERESAGKMQLLQKFLASLRLECGGRACIGTLPQGIFAETGTTTEDTEGLVDYARSVDGVEIGVLIEEQPDGIKASLRSKDPIYRVDLIAAQFNGGGHACAAGLNIKESATAFMPRLLAALAVQIATVAAQREST